MLAEVLTKDFIWNSYIRFFLTPFESFIPWVIAIIITGFVINKILDHLYYRLIQSGSTKNLTHKRCRVLCSNYNTRPVDEKKESYK